MSKNADWDSLAKALKHKIWATRFAVAMLILTAVSTIWRLFNEEYFTAAVQVVMSIALIDVLVKWNRMPLIDFNFKDDE